MPIKSWLITKKLKSWFANTNDLKIEFAVLAVFREEIALLPEKIKQDAFRA